MNFAEYQTESTKTDQIPTTDLQGMVVPLLGLAGETGALLTQYKKYLRDGDAYHVFNDRIGEELGDILWYVSAIATKFGIALDDIALRNLKKTRSRWQSKDETAVTNIGPFDEGYPPAERLPRKFVATIKEHRDKNTARVELFVEGKQVGNFLTDNAYSDDGYRFHDLFHLAYATVLGWSPVLRANMGRKRKSNKQADEVEDGGRAIAIEEGVSALVFAYAKKHSFLEGISALDWGLLRTISEMSMHLEVGQCRLAQWEDAILQGYSVWRAVRQEGKADIACDLDTRSINLVS